MSVAWAVASFIWQYPPNRGQRLRRLCVGLLWQLHKRIVGLPIVYRLDNGARYVAYPQSVGASFPFYAPEYDFPLIRFHRSWLSGFGTIVDIGANIGLYALSLAPNCRSAILVEPDPVAFRMLKENVALNAMESRVMLVQAAAGDVDKEVFLAQDDVAGLTNHVASAGQISVRQLTVDTILASLDRPRFPGVEFVKIDVEGYELNVLMGMTELIDGPTPPKLVQFERLERTPIRPLLEFFQSRDWTVFAVGDDCRPTTDAVYMLKAHDLMATSHPLVEFGG